MTIDRTLPLDRDGNPVVWALRLEVVEGPDQGAVFTAEGERVAVGTGKNNELVLTDPTVSQYHLELVRTPEGIRACDLGSTNATMTGGVRLVEAIVPPGCELNLGNTVLRITDGAPLTLESFEGSVLGVVGRSPSMRRLMARVLRAAKSDVSLLLLGETGTGKEVIARAIHEHSDRAAGPMETVDCGAIIPNLIGSELFGHEKGAFTGAESRHIGAFERAHGGTLFIDEIGELPANLQTALLGALERRSFRRIGGRRPVDVDVRVVFATHRDLRSEVNAGTFRQDLFYRIAVVVLNIPPLRDREGDVPLLAEHFLRRAGYDGPVSAVLSARAMDGMSKHRWPGNVRELRNVIEAALVMGEPPALTGESSEPGAPAPPPVSGEPQRSFLDRPYSEARALAIESFERDYIVALLDRCEQNVSEAARTGGMNRAYLTRLLKRHGIRGS